MENINPINYDRNYWRWCEVIRFVVLFLQRQKLNQHFDDSSDSEDEQPQIVIVKSGDLSAEQVEAEKRRIESGKLF